MIRTSIVYGLIVMATLLALPTLTSAAQIIGADGDEFEIWFEGASDFRLRTDPADDFLSDPTLILTEGHTYTFTHSGAMHPFAFLDNAAPIAATGSSVEGNEFIRTVNDQSFMANVLDGGSMIVYPTGGAFSSTLDWTPTQGDYYYTCAVQWHTNMAGRITVQAAASGVPEPTAFGLSAVAIVGLACLRRRRR